jgi:lipopolysaccharide transport system permease protein
MKNNLILNRPSPGYAFDAVTALIGRELRIRYKGSWLGLLWAVLSPLGMVAVMHIVFTRLVPLGIPNYAAFIFAGLISWTWFQTSVMTGSSTLLDNRDLVRKPFFPRALLPLTVTGTNFVLYLLALPVLLALLLFEGVPLSPALLALPVIWVVQFLFTLACTVIFAALSTIVRDVQHLLGVLMILWFYLTPIFYDLERVGGDGVRLLYFNPLAVLIMAHRAVALHGQTPNWAALAWCGLFSALLLCVALIIFHALEDAFVEEV